MSEPIRNISLAAIAQALRDGSLSAVELTQNCIDAREASLNAYRQWTPELALEQARAADAAFANAQDSGMLQGIPISVKDLYGVNGTQTFAGSPAPMPSPWQAEGDLISGLRAQHAVFSGKTHTVEFAFGGLGVNSHWGTPRNPGTQIPTAFLEAPAAAPGSVYVKVPHWLPWDPTPQARCGFPLA